MKANRSFRLVAIVALALLAVSFVPTPASAQVYRGKFTLPFAANWNGVVMTPGEYTFSVDKVAPAGVVTIQRDGKNVGLVQLASIAGQEWAGKSKLVVIPDGQTNRISVLRVHDEYVIHFLMPKNERKMPAQAPELSLRVPITDSNT